MRTKKLLKNYDGPPRYGLYPRVSGVIQDERDISLPAQEREMREHVAKEGGIVTHVFKDVGSATSADDRTGLQEAIQAARQGEYDFLLCHKSDRVFRNMDDAVAHKSALKKWGVIVKSATESFVGGATPIEIAMERIADVMAELFINNLKTEVRKGLDEIATGKGRQSGRPPFGYLLSRPEVRGSDWAVDPDMAPWVPQMFAWCAGGMAIGKIAARLNAADIPTPFSAAAVGKRARTVFTENKMTPQELTQSVVVPGMTERERQRRTLYVASGHWYPTSVRQVLRNRAYIGEVVRNGQYHPGAHTPIVRVELWHTIQRILDARPAGRAEYSERGLLVGGLLRCPLCGSPMNFNATENPTMRRAIKRGEDVSDWPEERRSSDDYKCSNRVKQHMGKIMGVSAQEMMGKREMICPGFCIKQKIVLKLVLDALSQQARLGALVGEGSPIPLKPAVPVTMKPDTETRLARDAQRTKLLRERDGLPNLRRNYQAQQALGLMTLSELKETLDGLELRRVQIEEMLAETEGEEKVTSDTLTAGVAKTLADVLTDPTLDIVQKRDALRVAVRFIGILPDRSGVLFYPHPTYPATIR